MFFKAHCTMKNYSLFNTGELVMRGKIFAWVERFTLLFRNLNEIM